MDLKKKTFFIVTGASRGIGKTMAIEISKKLNGASVVVLLARNKELLEETKTIIVNNNNNATNKEQLKVYTYSVDFENAQAEVFKHILSQTLKSAQETATQFERAIILHNAGTTGDVTKSASNVPDTSVWTKYLHTNLFASVALNCEFFSIFTNIPKLVINISSLCAIKPFNSMVYYCTGKAARDMYFRALAAEENDAIVLNYAPGAIDTDMTVHLQEESSNKELTEQFKQQRANKTMLTTQKTTQKLLQILAEAKFKSGDHVDYYD